MRFLVVAVALLAPAASFVVFTCCPTGQTWHHSACHPLDSSFDDSDWAPVVYSPKEATFLSPGTTPPDWQFLVSRPQACSEPFHVPDLGAIPSVVLFVNGSLFLQEEEVFVQPGAYCVDRLGALVCLSDDRPADPRPATRKCCGPQAAYSETNGSCYPAQNDDPLFEGWKVLSGFPTCTESLQFHVGGALNSTYFLEEGGSLRVGRRHLNNSQYCLERLVERPSDPVHVFYCVTKGAPSRDNDIRFTLYPVGLFLSVFFLAVTLIASCLLPSTYHVLHWRCQTNHVACLLIGDLLLAVTQLSGPALIGPACVSIAIAMHFIFLAAFFWLNTMCFNIWWTFRDLRPASLDKGQEVCRLRLYELYAWGCPLVIAGVAALVDSLPEDSQPSFLRPRFGEQRCWFFGDSELLYYFFGPIGLLLVINLTLFAMTARELTCGLWKTEVVKSNTERAALGRVCLKLVVVMGVTWVADLVSWMVGGPNYVWFLTDLVNALQGVLIFAVVGCQPQVWAAVKRLWCLRDTPSTQVRSSSSHAMPSIGSDHNTSLTKPVETLC